jgi:DNA-binding HxlR family transcriptional regulator
VEGTVRRELPAHKGDENCHVRDVLDRVGDKWSIHVVYLLANGPMRFTELKREVEGISQRMLTVTLRGLEREGLVGRTVYPVVPPRVEYRLTALGETLLDAVSQLMGWTLDHVSDIDLARKTYDAASATSASPSRATASRG